MILGTNYVKTIGLFVYLDRLVGEINKVDHTAAISNLSSCMFTDVSKVLAQLAGWCISIRHVPKRLPLRGKIELFIILGVRAQK